MKALSLLVTITVAVLALVVPPARAVDGVKLLNPPAHFPLIISAPGSYRLKKNFTVPDANTTGVPASS